MSKQNVCNGADLPVRFDCPNCRCKEAWQIPGALQLRFQNYQDWGQIYALMELLT